MLMRLIMILTEFLYEGLYLFVMDLYESIYWTLWALYWGTYYTLKWLYALYENLYNLIETLVLYIYNNLVEDLIAFFKLMWNDFIETQEYLAWIYDNAAILMWDTNALIVSPSFNELLTEIAVTIGAAILVAIYLILFPITFPLTLFIIIWELFS
jgi:hypothetical protein